MTRVAHCRAGTRRDESGKAPRNRDIFWGAVPSVRVGLHPLRMLPERKSARLMQSATSPAAPSRLTTILIWSIAVLAALFLVWPVWRAFFPMEIWGNEGWNAYHADQAIRGSGLYPTPDGFVASNYPPLSYYLIGWLGRLFA